MVKITMEATKNETFAEIFKTATYKIPATNLVEKERPLTTTNYLVDNHIVPTVHEYPLHRRPCQLHGKLRGRRCLYRGIQQHARRVRGHGRYP